MAVREGVAAGLIVVAADVHVGAADGPERGSELQASIPSQVLDQVGLIDHADRPEGRVAAILVLALPAGGELRHHGYGSGADGPLPAWTPP